MEKFHPRSIAALLLIVSIISSCCVHKSATNDVCENTILAKNGKDSFPLSNDTLLTAIQNSDSLLLYKMASPQQKDTLAHNCDSIIQLKIEKDNGKVSLANTSIFNFLINEDGIFSSDYPVVKQAFSPDYALKCYQKDKIYILLFSFGSEELRIITQYSSEKTYKICKMKTILHWFDLANPNDNYIKSILKWKQ